MPPGRPRKDNPKWTQENRQRILQATRAGNHPETSARYGRTNWSILRRWLAKGEQLSLASEERPLTPAEKEYADFFEQFQEAEASAEVRTVLAWQQAVPNDWRAAMKFLERRHPQKWSEKVEISLGQRDEEIMELLESFHGDAKDEDGMEIEVEATEIPRQKALPAAEDDWDLPPTGTDGKDAGSTDVGD